MPPCSARAITRKLGDLVCAARMPFIKHAARTSGRARAKKRLSEFRTGVNILMDVHGPFLRFYLLCGHRGVKPQIEESHHHLVPTLLPPYHTFGRVWIFGIVGRIIEMGGAFDF